MGEAKRRKKLLGEQYGKPTNRNSQVAIFALNRTERKIKKTELSRPPIPAVEHLKLKLNSVELRDWLIDQWGSLLDFVFFVTAEDACKIASKLLERLSGKFPQDLSSDSTISYALSPEIQVSVGINVYNWTVWAGVEDRSTGFLYITSDADEFRLACH